MPHVVEYDWITGGSPASQSSASFNGCTCSIRNEAAEESSVPNGSIAIEAASATRPTTPRPPSIQLPSEMPLYASTAESAMEKPVAQPLSPVPALKNPDGSAGAWATSGFGEDIRPRP